MDSSLLNRPSATVMPVQHIHAKLLVHVILTTKNRVPGINLSAKKEFYQSVWEIHKTLACNLYRVSAVEDHIHLLTSIPATLSLTSYMRELKNSTVKWMKTNEHFANFPGWQEGFTAFSVTYAEKDQVVEYIKNQENIHRFEAFIDEYRRLITGAGIEFDERFLV